MSNIEIIKLWRQRAEIDYVNLFIPLWLSLIAWIKDGYKDSTKKSGKNKDYERHQIEWFKSGGHELSERFIYLMTDTNDNKQHIDKEIAIFRGYFVELHRAFENADITFNRPPKDLKKEINQKVSFKNTILDWLDDDPKFTNITRKIDDKPIDEYEYIDAEDSTTDDVITFSEDFCIDNNISNAFKAYIENLYQVRCHLFHSSLEPADENERVIRFLYLTLYMIMKGS